MDSSRPDSRLSAIQRDLLAAFFARESRFFLTGGGALGGFHLAHRPSDDLDLFTLPPATLDPGERALVAAAQACRVTLVPKDRFPDFRRFVAERGAERTVVDLVVDRAPQLEQEKMRVGGVRIDSLLEIAANKVCALLSRNEPKDLVDLKAILDTGITLENALRGAVRKDGGANAANLAFVLDQWRIGVAARLPGDVDAGALEAFRLDLVDRLSRLAFPGVDR
ncbi:MAG: nucleotidyl transferase AbiEii/AbiGii toxin family protein [Deltaproteobacteria bacterium]|nr:nucleotidyl transferase AbiEii/AbiGii toxin family protein [Deltaproteobacteria bacterium]